MSVECEGFNKWGENEAHRGAKRETRMETNYGMATGNVYTAVCDWCNEPFRYFSSYVKYVFKADKEKLRFCSYNCKRKYLREKGVIKND